LTENRNGPTIIHFDVTAILPGLRGFAMTSGLRRAALAAFLTAMMALPAHAAIVFNFSWTGDPAEDPAIVSSPNATLRAVGTITIDALAGAGFTTANVVATSIAVSGAGLPDFAFTGWNLAEGTIAADGLSALFTDAFVQGGANVGFFGCEAVDCFNSVVRARLGTDANDVVYTSAANALASMRMTAVPLPAGLPLLLGGLGLLLLAGSRRGSA
jgi:hypothetical protein